MPTVALANGGYATIDGADCDRLAVHVWRRHSSGYAYRYERDASGRRRPVWMHREILGLTSAVELGDHRNGDRLDNRRSNLRRCSHAENMRNRRKHQHSTLRFKGVQSDISSGRREPRYRARLTVDGRLIRSRWFHNDLDAARAYDALSERYHGEFGVRNFTATVA